MRVIPAMVNMCMLTSAHTCTCVTEGDGLESCETVECVFTSTHWLMLMHTSHCKMIPVLISKQSFSQSSPVSKLLVKTVPYIEPIASLISLASACEKFSVSAFSAILSGSRDLWPRLIRKFLLDFEPHKSGSAYMPVHMVIISTS